MLNITQVMRIRGGKRHLISKETYPNVLDAIRYHYKRKGATESEVPVEVRININNIYLERLEAFLKTEIDLPGFYAFVEGRGGKFEKQVVFTMCKSALNYILDTMEGKNQHEYIQCIAEIKLPATGGTVFMPSKLVGEC